MESYPNMHITISALRALEKITCTEKGRYRLDCIGVLPGRLVASDGNLLAVLSAGEEGPDTDSGRPTPVLMPTPSDLAQATGVYRAQWSGEDDALLLQRENIRPIHLDRAPGQYPPVDMHLQQWAVHDTRKSEEVTPGGTGWNIAGTYITRVGELLEETSATEVRLSCLRWKDDRNYVYISAKIADYATEPQKAQIIITAGGENQ